MKGERMRIWKWACWMIQPIRCTEVQVEFDMTTHNASKALRELFQAGCLSRKRNGYACGEYEYTAIPEVMPPGRGSNQSVLNSNSHERRRQKQFHVATPLSRSERRLARRTDLYALARL